MLLAIDTATRMLSLAIHDGTQILAEQTWQAPNNHTEILAPALSALVGHAGMTTDDLTALAVVQGPGSYTGVRIGVAMAKGLAASRNLPLVGINTLEALAAGQPKYAGTLIAVVKAGRGRVVAGRYRWSYDSWVPRGEPRLLKWAALFETIDSEVTLAGELGPAAHTAYETARESRPDLTIHFAPPAYSLRRASFAAEVAWTRLRDGDPADFPAVQLAPIYMNTIE